QPLRQDAVDQLAAGGVEHLAPPEQQVGDAGGHLLQLGAGREEDGAVALAGRDGPCGTASEQLDELPLIHRLHVVERHGRRLAGTNQATSAPASRSHCRASSPSRMRGASGVPTSMECCVTLPCAPRRSTPPRWQSTNEVRSNDTSRSEAPRRSDVKTL